MRKVFEILKIYASPYKLYIVGNIILNLFQSVFSVFSLALIIPFLGILFGTQEKVTTQPEFTYSLSTLVEYFNYEVTQIIEKEGPTQALFSVSIFIFVMIILKNAFAYSANMLIGYMRNSIIRDLRVIMYQKFLDLPLSYHSSTQKGNLISRLTNDVQTVEGTVMSVLALMFREPLSLIVFLIALFNISSQLTVTIFLLLMIIGAAIGWVGKSLKKYSAGAQQKLAEVMSIVEETLGGLRIVKAFTAEQHMAGRFNKIVSGHFRLTLKTIYRTHMASPMSEVLGVLLMIGLMNYGGILVLEGDSSLRPETFIGYIAIFSQIIDPAKSLSRSYYAVQKGLAPYARIEEILEVENPLKLSQGNEQLDNFKGNIEFKNVSFSYAENQVLNQVNLKIEFGKTLALVGQSGAGKSTLVDLIPRFYDVSQGEILIDEKNVKDIKLTNLRKLIGFVNQESILFNDTIFNNIAFGIENATQADVEAAAKVANAHEFIRETPDGYQTNIGDGGGKLSGGQRQRISIARSILKNPPILILDEATSALDTESERLVQDALNKLMKNRTSIVIAHRLSTIKQADEICVMQDGKIVERGKHDTLLQANNAYKRLHDIQNA